MKQRSGMPYDVVAFTTDERAVLWTLEEEGAFHRLLRHAWVNGSLPDDLTALAIICRCDMDQMKKMWVNLEQSWPVDGRNGRRFNRKQEAERQYVKTKAEAGRIGGSTPKAKRKQNTQECLSDASIKTQAPIPSPSHPISINTEEENKNHPADAAANLFAEVHQKNLGAPYPFKRADFVKLADLRKAHHIQARASPEGWESAIENYFASPLGSYTLADLATRFPILKLSRLDRYGKPVNHQNAGGQDGKTKTDRNREAAQRLRSRLDFETGSGGFGGDF